MTEKLNIRKSLQDDIRLIEQLYPRVFPDEDLLPLVLELLAEDPPVLSLVATCRDDELAGHVIFTPCALSGSSAKVALLGPLAVNPTWQRQGVGSALVRAGLSLLEEAGTVQVHVLGDPAYYGRFGFEPNESVTPPYKLPEEWHDAWQSLNLGSQRPHLGGQLCVPPPWRQEALWME